MVLLERNIFAVSKKWDIGGQKKELYEERQYHPLFISKLPCFMGHKILWLGKS